MVATFNEAGLRSSNFRLLNVSVMADSEDDYSSSDDSDYVPGEKNDL